MLKRLGWADLSATEKAEKDAVKVREMAAAKKTNAAEAHKLEGTEFEEILVSLLGLSSVPENLSRGSPQFCKRSRIDDGAPP